MADGYYSDYSKGKAFFSDRSGVSYWKEKIGNHLEHQGKNSKLSVVKFPKHWVSNPEKDEIGTGDSGRNSYYSKSPIRSPKQQADPTAEHNLKSHMLWHKEKKKVLATSDSPEELEKTREKLHQAGKADSWHTAVHPSREYQYHLNLHRYR
ncbi:unnamed protein product [Sphagnum tenellum]